MKKILLSVSAVLVFSALSAQSAITSTINPTVGTNLSGYMSAYVSEGNSGANQTWDLSALSSTGTYTRAYTATSVSGANIRQTTTTGGNTAIVDMMDDNSGQKWISVNSGGTIMTYSNPMTLISLPASYGASTTDNFACTFTSGGVNFSRSGTITQTYDGYGTLTTPEGTFTNVSRMHFHQVYSDVSSSYQLDYVVDIYAWYKAGVVDELASVNTLTYTFMGQSQTSQSGLYRETNGLGIAENEIGALSAYPNPAVSDINLDLSEEGVNNIVVTDIQGKIYALDYTVMGNKVVLNTNDLRSGVYFIRAEYASGKVEAAKVSKI